MRIDENVEHKKEGKWKKERRTTNLLSAGLSPLASKLFALLSNTQSFSFSAYSQPAGERSESAL
jgi:hypothetical protein